MGKGNAIVIRRRIREEYADDLSGKEVADQRQHGAERNGKYQREFEGASVTLPVFRTDTKTEQRLNALPKSDTNHACHHCDLHGNAHTGYRHIAVFCHLTVHKDAGKAHQKISQGSRNADCQNAGGNLFLHGKVLEADAEGGRAFQEVDNVISCAHHISDNGCNGCTGNVPAEHKNHNGVKNDIQEISQKLPNHRLAGLSLGTNDIRVAVGDQDKRTGAAYNRQIGSRIVPGFRACADQRKDLIHENQEQRRHQHSDSNTTPHTERADLFCIVLPSFAQGAGDHRGAADTEDRSHGHKQQENRRGKGNCRHLQIVMGLPDKERVRQIVDQHHEHRRHCGQCVL